MLPDSLRAVLDEQTLGHAIVQEVITHATARSPWVLSVRGCSTPYAILCSSGAWIYCHTLSEAFDLAGGAEQTDRSDVYELVPADEDGPPIVAAPPLTFRGQLADILIFQIPRDAAFATEQMARVNLSLRQALANAARDGFISGNPQVMVLPEGCRLFRLKEKK